jgi:hypothetical protein
MSQYEDRFTREQAAEDGERLAHGWIAIVLFACAVIATGILEGM